jgi:hypothetical protein
VTARVRKARRASVLACGHYVMAGQRIVSRDHGRWVCLDCALGRFPARAAGGARAGAPGPRPR